MTEGRMPVQFSIKAGVLRDLIDRTRFAISTEETRYYLNGIYIHATESEGQAVLRAVATDGHRLARVEEPLPEGAKAMPGVIIPRKTVNEIRKLAEETQDEIVVRLSDTKVQFALGTVTLTSKLIDGTFPEYERVIPRGNDKKLVVPRKDFAICAYRRQALIRVKRRKIWKVMMSLIPAALWKSASRRGICPTSLIWSKTSWNSSLPMAPRLLLCVMPPGRKLCLS